MSGVALLAWILALPVISACAVVVARARPNLRESLTVASGIVLFLLVVALYRSLDWDNPSRLVLAEPFPGLQLAFEPEPLGLLFAMVAGFLWPVTSVYAVGYMRAHHEQHQTRFFAAFAVSIGATMGIAFAANMFTLFVFYEILTVATYPLVTHAGTDEARRAGRVYLGILMGTSVSLLLLATVWTWQLTGTLEFTRGGVFDGQVDGVMLGVLLALYVFGTGKAALMPFHRWLPAAMVAPTPVSALLHAVAVVKAGVFTILKVVVYLFGIDVIADLMVADLLAALAALTILIASLVAMTRDNLKARLAYSTVSQLGYIVLGAMLGATAGVVGGSMHIVMHAFGKITLFFCAGAILVAAHKTRVSELDGLGRRMPLTMFAFLVGALSIVGLPPLGGTWSKWVLVQGTLDTGAWLLTAVLLLSSLLNVAYLVSIPVRGFFRKPTAAQDGIREAPLASLIAIGVTAVGCVALFFWADPVYQVAGEITR
ncbi:MAG: monovalent cation/H+ antiporter subunit D family protein [Chromatiaceae bacterium]|nr:monovalent cation/H+ antiporter subunit D family protein [Chromatiaceae bacterium]MCP5314261.1 monovalent cation/H+ antiporter subunit D family protein [Chromatiaceae bacterium]